MTSAASLSERLIQAAVDYESGRCSSRELAEARAAVESAIHGVAQPTPEDVETLRRLADSMGFGRTHDALRRILTALASQPPAAPVDILPAQHRDASKWPGKADMEAAHNGSSAGTEGETKTVYVKRWRTLVKLPAKYADEIVAALRAPDEPQAPSDREGGK